MISLEHVGARAGAFQLSDITFEIPRGGYGVVIGPAGAGKTTLLETIAGVISTTAGRIRLGERDCTKLPPERRGLGIVYQHAYLFPHLNVRENIAYGAASAADATEVAERFGIAALGSRTVDTLSGGERQLVAIARALARRPSVLLLDEPFSALDPRSRTSTRRLMRAVHAERGFTVLQVTHDFAEAGMLGDIAIVLDGGRVVQQGEPEQVFRKPASPYIADFLGAENVFAGTMERLEGQGIAFRTGELTFYAMDAGASVDMESTRAVHAVIRAEEVSLSATHVASSVQNQFSGTIAEIAHGGGLSRITISVRGTPLVAAVTTKSVRELGLEVGREIIAAFKATAVHLC
jgi:molybdopterin-binding protein